MIMQGEANRGVQLWVRETLFILVLLFTYIIFPCEQLQTYFFPTLHITTSLLVLYLILFILT